MLAISFSAALALTAGFGMTAKSPAAEAATSVPASQISENIQLMTYQLYAGGINAVRAKLEVAYENEDRYKVELFATTQGFLGKLAPWQGTFETHGWRLKDGQEVPELHKSTAVWKEEEDIKEYSYSKDGTFKGLHIIEAGKEEPAKELDDELVQGTTDALTAALQAMKSVSSSGVCAENENESDEIFDGRRRYKLVFHHRAEEMMTASDYNVYEGPAVRCEVEVVPVAGAWHKKPRGWASIQEQGRAKGSLPTVWLAKIDETGPAVPVKLRVKTDYGTLFMHLVQYDNGDKTITAEKEKK